MTAIFPLSGTSPAAASTVAGASATGLSNFSALRVDAVIQGATGGTLNVYLQRNVAPNVWVDWVHFTQLAAAATAVAYSFCVQLTTSTTVIATNVVSSAGTDAVPAPAIAASLVAEHPGDQVRVVYVAGAGTSAGAAQSIRVTGIGLPR